MVKTCENVSSSSRASANASANSGDLYKPPRVCCRSGRHTSAAEVLYAACWLVGEFSSLLARPRQALLSMISGLAPGLAPHIQVQQASQSEAFRYNSPTNQRRSGLTAQPLRGIQVKQPSQSEAFRYSSPANQKHSGIAAQPIRDIQV